MTSPCSPPKIKDHHEKRSLRKRWFCYLIALQVYFIAACSPLELSPITSTNTGHNQPGKVIWHDLLTGDLENSKQFYRQLFHWSFRQNNGYTVVLNNGVPIAGIVSDDITKSRLERAWWLIYISIEDVEGTAHWVEDFGGRILKGPGEMANRGDYVMIKDPQGAPLVLLDSATGDPRPSTPDLNGWLWNELWASDVEAALDFYQPLGGYAADLVSQSDEGKIYWVLATGLRWHAGVTAVPFKEVPPQWVPVIRVADPESIVARVPSLGGRVLVNPDHPLGSGRLALIEDPEGALVMVESWEPEALPTKEQDQ